MEKLDLANISLDDMIDVPPVDPKKIEVPNPDPANPDPANPPTPPANPDPPKPNEKDTEPNPVDDPNPSDPPSYVASLMEDLGVKVEGEFEDTPEGLLNYLKEAVPTLAKKEMDSFFEDYPAVKEYADYLMAGGDPEKYHAVKSPEVDFSKIEVDSENTSQQKAIITAYLQAAGETDEDIQSTLEEYEVANILESRAKKALQVLARQQEQEKAALLENQRKQAELEKKEAEKFWAGIKEKLDNKPVLKGITIPEVDRKAYFDYISKPVKNNKSQAELDAEQEDVDTQMMIDYLRFKKFNFNDLIKASAKTSATRNLKEILKDEKPPKNTGVAKSKALQGLEGLSLDTIFNQSK